MTTTLTTFDANDSVADIVATLQRDGGVIQDAQQLLADVREMSQCSVNLAVWRRLSFKLL